jgi:hypothetical protein
MIFKYYEVDSHLSRPIIPIILKSSNKIAIYSALIDSGSDDCIFGIDIAESMGIKLNPKNKIDIIGFGRDKIEGYRNELVIRIGSYMYVTNVIFAKIRDLDHGILGHRGFFDHFDVRLSYQKQIIEVNLIES